MSGAGVKGGVAGFVVGLIAGGILAMVVGHFVVQDQKLKATRGWELEYVICAAEDIEAGTVIDHDLIQQSPMPVQFITASLLRPEHLNELVGRRLRSDVKAGDPLVLGLLELTEEPEQEEALEEEQAEESSEDAGRAEIEAH